VLVTTTKRPAFQFYPSDWRNDLALRTCSIGARGLWQELLCTMHEGTPYGHLALDGVALSDEEAASLAGVPLKDYTRLLAELERRKVCSRTPDGVVFSRRMVRDEELRNKRAAAGEAGKEHGQKGARYGAKGGRPPKEKGGRKTPLKTPLAPETETPVEPPPSSSSSSSASLTPSAAAAALSPLAGAAAAASEVGDPAAYGKHRDRIAAQFTDERARLAFERHCRASRFPDALLLDIEAASRERPSDGAPGVPWDVIGTVLHELSVKDRRPTEHLIRVFSEPMLTPRDPRTAAPRDRQKTDAEIEAEFMARIERGEFLPPELREVPA
jgi:hypothetical protein